MLFYWYEARNTNSRAESTDPPGRREASGGFLGYELGRMAGEHEQQPQGGNSMNPDAITPLSQGGYDPGMNYPADAFIDGDGPDFGGFGGEGADFGGGDFGSGSD
jgi:hypothetical protein